MLKDHYIKYFIRLLISYAKLVRMTYKLKLKSHQQVRTCCIELGPRLRNNITFYVCVSRMEGRRFVRRGRSVPIRNRLVPHPSARQNFFILYFFQGLIRAAILKAVALKYNILGPIKAILSTAAGYSLLETTIMKAIEAALVILLASWNQLRKYLGQL